MIPEGGGIVGFRQLYRESKFLSATIENRNVLEVIIYGEGS